jgi:hypothetical protein
MVRQWPSDLIMATVLTGHVPLGGRAQEVGPCVTRWPRPAPSDPLTTAPPYRLTAPWCCRAVSDRVVGLASHRVGDCQPATNASSAA